MIYDLPVEKSAHPPDWCVLTLNQLADVVGGGTPDTGEPAYWNPPDIPWVTPTDITACPEPILIKTERSISQAGLRDSSATLLPVGTTLLTSRATVGECRLAGVPVATNQGFASLVPREGTGSEFLSYLAQTLRPAFVRLAAGTTFIEVSRREVRRVKVCVPSTPGEREGVGSILSVADNAIQALKAKRTAAQRLETALMQQLFTRGIPGRHTKFKQTKIGVIPDEWDVIALGSIADIDAGVALNPDREPRRNGYRYLTVVNVQRERIDLSEVRHLELWDSEIPGKLLREGDIVAVEGHANSSEIGRAAMVPPEADGMAFQNHLFRVRLRPDVDFNSSFLLGCLNSERVRRHWNATANTSSGLNTINRRGLRKLRIPRPRRSEQDDIVALIDAANSNIRATEDELLAVHRLKTSLLQNLLTGKVRIKMED